MFEYFDDYHGYCNQVKHIRAYDLWLAKRTQFYLIRMNCDVWQALWKAQTDIQEESNTYIPIPIGIVPCVLLDSLDH